MMHSWARQLTAVCFLVVAARAAAQPQPADPLMQLMLSQPQVDIQSPVVVTATFDPPIVRVGEKSVYRVSLNAIEASVRWPQEFPVPPGLKAMPGGHGQLLQQLGNIQRPISALNLHVRGERPGFYAFPAFWIEVYGKPVVVPEARLEVISAQAPAREPARQLLLIPATTNAFVGESISVRVVAPAFASNVIQTLNPVDFLGAGLVADKSSFRQRLDHVELNGRRVPTMVCDTTLTPITAGPLEISAQSFTGTGQFIGQITVSGQVTIMGASSSGEPVLLDSDPVTIHVRPLPPQGDSEGFTGFIGSLSVDPPRLSTNALRVGEAARLHVVFRGDPGVARLVPPPPPRVAGWEIFPAAPAELPVSPHPPTNTVVAFAYTLMALSDDVKETPRIPFQIFDSKRGEYLDRTIPPVRITVTADGLPTNWNSLVADMEEGARRQERPKLSVLATARGHSINTLVPLQLQPWFIGVQITPGLLLAGWWYADRRRRYLAAHPEIVRRRRTLRALRVERRVLKRAAAQANTNAFTQSAVAAIQIAASPHFPAAPRALVCGEVLGLFDEPARRGRTGEIIRSLFARDEAGRYGTDNMISQPVLELKPELDAILDQMEAWL